VLASEQRSEALFHSQETYQAGLLWLAASARSFLRLQVLPIKRHIIESTCIHLLLYQPLNVTCIKDVKQQNKNFHNPGERHACYFYNRLHRQLCLNVSEGHFSNVSLRLEVEKHKGKAQMSLHNTCDKNHHCTWSQSFPYKAWQQCCLSKTSTKSQ